MFYGSSRCRLPCHIKTWGKLICLVFPSLFTLSKGFCLWQLKWVRKCVTPFHPETHFSFFGELKLQVWGRIRNNAKHQSTMQQRRATEQDGNGRKGEWSWSMWSGSQVCQDSIKDQSLQNPCPQWSSGMWKLKSSFVQSVIPTLWDTRPHMAEAAHIWVYKGTPIKCLWSKTKQLWGDVTVIIVTMGQAQCP